MSLLNAILSNKSANRQSAAESLKGFADQMEARRFANMTKEFVQSWDGTPQGAKAFAVAKGLDGSELAGVLSLAKEYQTMVGATAPTWKEMELQDESGNILKKLYDASNPSNQFELGVKSRPKPEKIDMVNPDDFSKSAMFANPYNQISKPALTQEGKSVVTERPPTYTGQGMTEDGTPLQGRFSEATGEPQGPLHVSGRSIEQEADLRNRVEQFKNNLDGLEGLDPQTKDMLSEIFLKTLNLPAMGIGATGLRKEIYETAAKKLNERGGNVGDIVRTAAETKADTASLQQQQKNRGMMGSFVRNLDKQLDRVDTFEKDIQKRLGVRALDMPIRSLKRAAIGSGFENVLEAYTVEISNEIGKLSTGSSASVRELSVDAQERWAKIHDPNLSFTELKKILDETRHMARMRLESTEEEINATAERIGKIGGNKSDASGVESLSDEDLLKQLGL